MVNIGDREVFGIVSSPPLYDVEFHPFDGEHTRRHPEEAMRPATLTEIHEAGERQKAEKNASAPCFIVEL